MIAAMVSGAGVLCAGLWMLWGRRVYAEDRGPGESGMEEVGAEEAGPAEGMQGGGSFRDRFSEPTRLVIGLSLLLVGYHLAAWGAPDGWFGVKVPRDRWWLLIGGLAIAVMASLALDRLEQKKSRG
ncbi:MAG: hypothetical protein IT436_12200 [Phycisphaerales bacterium]|nr:hypothetical protein [Phycisphaerales bacterium]